ncbi:hypothetical protein GN244_ATG06997 [Phytophthora infestans]|uniref:Uncharacterized protein n=1 Tax=Phytophthora infestans TaxID=4787 RepID=A0A833VY15_PHYIN|nr:hypothetical protein GN244_ATG14744 [Phytophthora infestans]KAF4040953.1 hypothetical protein GN244_ATG06997 [Phytophthora infestans]KAF4143438.1 hypothetical protein GN958_ATG07397 [Phytophthora infestans]
MVEYLPLRAADECGRVNPPAGTEEVSCVTLLRGATVDRVGSTKDAASGSGTLGSTSAMEEVVFVRLVGKEERMEIVHGLTSEQNGC